MNPIVTFAYRSFQTVFKLAIPILPYRTPEMLDSVTEIPAVLKKSGLHRVLVVTAKELERFYYDVMEDSK